MLKTQTLNNYVVYVYPFEDTVNIQLLRNIFQDSENICDSSLCNSWKKINMLNVAKTPGSDSMYFKC